MSTAPVWIDLANSPHVLFFRPVIDQLHRRGVQTVVTARDFAQTTQLCTRFGIDAEVIGRHGGASIGGKLLGLAQRVRGLRAFAQRTRPCAAASHNSYSQAVAARSLHVPVMTAMDYEYQPANHLAFRCADLVAVPEAFPLDRLLAQGARPGRTWRYPGLKEHIAWRVSRPTPATWGAPASTRRARSWWSGRPPTWRCTIVSATRCSLGSWSAWQARRSRRFFWRAPMNRRPNWRPPASALSLWRGEPACPARRPRGSCCRRR